MPIKAMKYTVCSLLLSAGLCAAGQAHSFTTAKFSYGQPSIGIVQVSDDSLSAGAESFVDEMANRAIGFLGNDSLSTSQKKKAFRKLLKRDFDLKTIGRFAMGRYWRSADSAQKSEYQSLFEDTVVNVYSKRFSDYSGQALQIKSSRKDSDKDITVLSVIAPDKGPKVSVDWRVRYKNGKYRIIDVLVEGVSMAVTQRSEFSSVIQRGGGDISVLLAHLRGE